ncbi:MAG TPA: hypothetical protein DCP31_19590 [Cyanobacteria bacterium UBA8543]|nr:hypothetical protein [Cyanobacteria bacterium UBA8543]
MPSVPPQIGEAPQQLPSLPGAEQEAKAIASLLKTQAITGNQATKPAVVQKMSEARFVHLATHGILDEELRQAIATLINRSLQPPGITAKTTIQADCLRVMLESEQVPDPASQETGLEIGRLTNFLFHD